MEKRKKSQEHSPHNEAQNCNKNTKVESEQTNKINENPGDAAGLITKARTMHNTWKKSIENACLSFAAVVNSSSSA